MKTPLQVDPYTHAHVLPGKRIRVSNEDCEIIDPRKSSDWDVFVRSRKDTTFFHTTAWAHVLCDSYGFLPCYIVLRSGKSVVAGLPLIVAANLWGRQRAVSLPFSDFCAPLCGCCAEHGLLSACARELCRKNNWSILELRGGQEFLEDAAVWSQCFTHTLDLTKSDKDLLAACRDSTRRNINKARNQSVTVNHEMSLSALHEFHRLNSLTRREHGLPPQPLSFLKNLFDAVIAPGNGFISLARFENKAVAADLFAITGERALYKYGAADRRYQHLRPSNLLLWEGLRRCKEMGARSLSLGRTEPHHTGLLQFKQGYGCTETTVNYYRYNVPENRFINGLLGEEKESALKPVLTRVPLPLLQLAGKLAYKYAG